MNAMEIGRPVTMAGSIARRAVELALDGAVSAEDGSDHLCRLSGRRRALLEHALDALPCPSDASPEEECARLLLHRAILGLELPDLFSS
jgi:hypothetical protein